ncbi:MAG: right-handed parallel beta-helix repeat-containing protein, partial [Candidatus Cloacimonetes bacterium]|nr:right-handed parallel beta-helix repeat-containing protein [Candidatus Cloacimonadota bacterium]
VQKNLMLVILSTLMLSGCYWFESIEQPLDAGTESLMPVSIDVMIFEDGWPMIPYFGICIPSGWSVWGDSIQCTGVYNEVIYYDQTLAAEQESVSPAPEGYHWWVGAGSGFNIPVGLVNGVFEILTDDQPGAYFLDYMLGDNYHGVNFRRSDDHQVYLVDEFTPYQLRAARDGNTIILSWTEPCNNEDLLGYMVYRDQEIINTDIILDTDYTDQEPVPGIHHYTISALYNDGSEHQNPVELPVVFGELYVSTSGDNTNSGSCWEEALLTVAYALAVSSPDSLYPLTINMAPGIYSPSTNGETFPVYFKSHVTIIGNGQDSTILDAEQQDIVVKFYNVTGASISSLTIKNGTGGGINSIGSNSDIHDTKITYNTAGSGGGIYLTNSYSSLTGVIIEYNDAVNGGGIFCDTFSNLELTDMTISNNYATASGGGIYLNNCYILLTNVSISDNCADEDGGGLNITDADCQVINNLISGNHGNSGGGIYCTGNSTVLLTDNTLSNNTADNGGGIFCYQSDDLELTDTTIANNHANACGGGIYCIDNCPVLLTNVIISDNSAFETGGGIHCADNSTALLTNVTITENADAEYGGGIYLWYSQLDLFNSLITENNGYWGCGIWAAVSSISISNSVIADNDVDTAAGAIKIISCNLSLANCILWNDEIAELQATGSFTIIYSDIQEGWEGEGNIDLDPLFCGTGDHPYSLLPDSPCIDTGTPDTTGLNLPPCDITGNQRIWDGDGDGIAIIDMGAYEFGAPPYVAVEENIIVQTPGIILHQNFPNPFNPSTIISFQLPANCETAELNIYNIKGQKIRSFPLNPSTHESLNSITWDGRDGNNKSVNSGIYLYHLKAGNVSQVRKMILLK